MKTIKYGEYELQGFVRSYPDKTNMAIQFSLTNGEPYSVPTVNLGPDIGNGTIMPRYCAFMDTNNSRGLVEELEKQGIIEPYTRFGEQVTKPSGYCEYPLYQFDKTALEEMDPEGLAEYNKKYNIAFQKEQSKMNDQLMGSDFNEFLAALEDDTPDIK